MRCLNCDHKIEKSQEAFCELCGEKGCVHCYDTDIDITISFCEECQ